MWGQTTVSWSNISGGSWTTASNWSPANVPNSGSYAASITAAGTYTVTMPSSEVINSLQLNSANATLLLGGSLYLTGNSSSIAAGTVQLSSANIVAEPSTGSLALTNAGTLTSIGGSNYVYGIYSSPNGLSFTNSGTVSVTAGYLTLGYGSGDTVVNSSTGLMKADGATLTVASNQATWSNAGTIEAINGGTVTLGNGTWGSSGTFTANSGGTINFTGSFTTAQLDAQTINGLGGTLNLKGTLTNTGATLASPASGIFTLNGGTITGGTVDNSTGQVLTFAGTSSLLDGVSMQGPFTVPSGASFWVANGTTFANGTTSFGNSYVYLEGTSNALTVASTATWTGNLSVYAEASGVGMTNNGSITNASGSNAIEGNGYSGFSFTNAGSVVVSGGSLIVGSGAGDTITNQSGGLFSVTHGYLTIGQTGSTVTNAGTLQASGSSSTLTLGTGSTAWSSTGSLSATNGGILNLGGNFTTANLGGTVDMSGGGVVNITGTLTNTGATLGAPHSGVYTLNGGTINGGTVASGALTFGSSAGTLDAVTMQGSFSVPNSGRFTAQDGTLFSGGTTAFASSAGTVNLGSSGTALTIGSDATWTGAINVYAGSGGTMVNQGSLINTTGYNYFYGGNSVATGLGLTNSGTISSTGGVLYLAYYTGDSVTNTGTINANAGTITLGYESGTHWSSTGELEATNGGTLNLGGNFTTANLGGTVDMSGGGVVNITGTLTNTGATLSAPHSGVYTLNGGTIDGGTVASGALTFGSSTGTLDGVTMQGSFAVPNSGRFKAQDGTVFSGGTTTFASSAGTVDLGSSGTALTIGSDATWTGAISVSAGSGGTMVNQGNLINASGYNYFYGGNSVATGLSLANSGTISSTAGVLYLGYYAGDSVTNTGTINANAGTITLGYDSGAHWSSTGELEATNGGTLNLGGSFTTANLGGTVDMSGGGVVNITGTLTNTGATLSAPHSGVYTLYDGTINGGTVASGALTFGSSSGTLDAVTMQGNFAVPYSGRFTAQDGTIFSGGTTTFSPSAGTVYLGNSGTALTIGSDATWTGAINVYAASGGSMVNQGNLINTSGYNYFYGGESVSTGLNLTNSGTLSSTGGVLYLGYYSGDSVTNTGTINANGGTIYLGYESGAHWSSTGELEATNGGTLNLGGSFTTANLGGTVDMSGGGVVNITGTLTNTGATLGVPHSGVYTLYGGTINGGTVASGALTFGSSSGTLDAVTMQGNFNVPSYGSFTVQDETVFSGGTTTFASSADSVVLGGSGTALTIGSDATWTGAVGAYANTASTLVNNGTINHGSGYNYISGNNNGLTLINNGTITSTGGTLTLGPDNGDVVTNNGTLSASGGTLIVGGSGSGASWSTSGAISATNSGTVDLDGSFSTSNLGGTVDIASGGVVNIEGTLTNTGATLVPPHSGAYTLYGGTIVGGTVASGAITFGSYAGLLDGVAMNGSFTVPSSARFNVDDNTIFSGGTTTFASGSNDVYLEGSGTGLTLAPSETWTGQVGLYADSSSPLTVLIQGVLQETTGSNFIYGYSGGGLTIINSGTIEASSSSLYLGYGASDSFTNQSGGVVDANGGTIHFGYYGSAVSNLSGSTLSGGTWEAVGGGILSFESSANPVATNNATIILNGSGSTLRTYTGSSSYQSLEQTLTTNAGTLEVLGNRGFTASNDLVNTGTLVIGGGTFTEHSITTGSGSVIAGTGTVSTSTGGITVGTGSSLSPGIATAGSYVGTLSFGSGTPLTLASGGAMTFDLKNASPATAGTDYDTISVAGSVSVTATPGSPFTVYVESINPTSGSPGSASINLGQSYQWTLLSAGSISGFNASDFTIDSSLFSNGVGGGSFSLTDSGTSLMLNFSPVPEPSTWALMGAGLAASLVAVVRRTPRRRIDPRRA